MDISTYSMDVQNWIKDINRGRGVDPRLVMDACAKLETRGLELGDDALIGFACFSRGENYYLLNDMDNFCTQMQKCQEPFERIGEWGYLAVSYNMLGIMAESRGNAPLAMDLYTRANDMCHDYNLVDMAWMTHMNIGALYLGISEYTSAIAHLQHAYHYMIMHPERDDYYQVLTICYASMGKAHMNLGNYIAAEDFRQKIELDCLSHIGPEDRFVVNIFEARLALNKGEIAELNKYTAELNRVALSELPLVEYFDDIYDYLQLLMETGNYPRFIECYDIIKPIAKKTGILNIQKRMLALNVRFNQIKGNIEESHKAAMVYVNVCEVMEVENRKMLCSMINIRNDMNRLQRENMEFSHKAELFQRKSQTDALTGISNRAGFNDFADRAFDRAYIAGTSFAIEMLDIDYFKQYNDNYGHQEGDKIIRLVAQEMQQLSSRDHIFCARYGGDEFIIIYEGMSKEQVWAASQEMKLRIHSKHIMHEHTLIESKVLTISQGVCWGIPKDQEQLSDYLHVADDNLYKVKKAGKNGFLVTGINGE